MAEDDIYGNKGKYERFKENLKNHSNPPQKPEKRVYYCKNPVNLKYFKSLFLHFEANDLSFVRRNRVLDTLRFIVFTTKKDLSMCQREDINKIMALMHTKNKTVESKKTFIKNLKCIWRILFPETDEKGRPDETLVPYAVRHISGKIDVSKCKIRKDRLTWEEFEQIVNYFSNDPRIQAYLTLQLESLTRPQELLFRTIGEIEHFDFYAKIYLTDHCKEKPSFASSIDSYPYLLKWLKIHPQADNKNAFIFVNTGNTNTLKQLHPANINKMLRKACKDLGIDKPITCYSLKRVGVSIRRIRGESDMEIQKNARWTSLKQLPTYDQTDQEDALKIALQRRGLVSIDKKTMEVPKSKKCTFCNQVAGFSETICPNCSHPLDRKLIVDEKKKDEEIQELRMTVSDYKNHFKEFKNEILKDFAAEILKIKSSMGALKSLEC